MSSYGDRRELCNVRCEAHALGSLQTVTYVFLFQGTVECGSEALEIAVSPNASQAQAAFGVLSAEGGVAGWRLPCTAFIPRKPVDLGPLTMTICLSPILRGMPDRLCSPEPVQPCSCPLTS